MGSCHVFGLVPTPLLLLVPALAFKSNNGLEAAADGVRVLEFSLNWNSRRGRRVSRLVNQAFLVWAPSGVKLRGRASLAVLIFAPNS